MKVGPKKCVFANPIMHAILLLQVCIYQGIKKELFQKKISICVSTAALALAQEVLCTRVKRNSSLLCKESMRKNIHKDV
jgi:hypothetical protein